jgi:predicted phage tail protein
MIDEPIGEELDGKDEGMGDESLRDTLEAALDGDTGESGSTDESGTGGTPNPAQEDGTEPAAKGADESGAANSSKGDGKSDGSAPAEAGKSGDGDRAPVGWNPELREQWAGLPDGVKQQIHQREQHMAQAMQGTAQARQVAQDFQGISQKYGSVMAAEGFQNPMQAVDTMLQTVTELRMGSPAQKAGRIAELIQSYGIDIKTLDDSLAAQVSGQPAPQQQQMDPNIQHMIDQRMQPMNQMMNQLAGMQQHKQQQGNIAAQQEVQQFAQNAEFLDDVRHDVADLIDMATKHGRDMPLQEAYDKACAMNPQIANVLAQRTQQQNLATAGQRMNSKKMAASSLAPGNRGANSSATPDTMMGQLNAAWDDQIG